MNTTPTGTVVPNRNQISKRKRRTFTAEQNAQAVRLAKVLGSVAKAARDLDLTESSLTNWVKQRRSTRLAARLASSRQTSAKN